MSFIKCGDHAWMQCSRWGRISDIKYGIKIFNIELPKVPFDHCYNSFSRGCRRDALSGRPQGRCSEYAEVFILCNGSSSFIPAPSLVKYLVLQVWLTCMTLHLLHWMLTANWMDHLSSWLRLSCSEIWSFSFLFWSRLLSSANIISGKFRWNAEAFHPVLSPMSAASAVTNCFFGISRKLLELLTSKYIVT